MSKKNFMITMVFQEDSIIEALDTARKITQSANGITGGDIIESEVGHPGKAQYVVFQDGSLGVKKNG